MATSALCRFLDDGRIELDNNTVERAIRPIALGRKNHLFAGSDGGGEHWAVIASLIETCKMNGIDPEAYLRDVLAKIVARIPVNRLGKAEEIARGVAFLVAEDGGFITGSTLSINGGQYMV